MRRVADGHDAHLGRHALEVGKSSADGVVRHHADERCSDGNLCGGLRGDRGRSGTEENFVDRRQLTELPKKADQFRSRSFAYRPIEQLRLELAGSRKQSCIPTFGHSA